MWFTLKRFGKSAFFLYVYFFRCIVMLVSLNGQNLLSGYTTIYFGMAHCGIYVHSRKYFRNIFAIFCSIACHFTAWLCRIFFSKSKWKMANIHLKAEWLISSSVIRQGCTLLGYFRNINIGLVSFHWIDLPIHVCKLSARGVRAAR